jgi:hypothetical protein
MDNRPVTGSGRRALLGASALALAMVSTLPAATAAERWAALSLLGDRMTVVQARPETGTRVNPNLVNAVPMAEDVLDRLALRAVVLAKVDGVPEIVPMALRDRRLYEAQDRLLQGDGALQPLLDAVLKTAAGVQATHLLLIAKSRGEASFAVREGHIGIGRVEGLGFYVDRSSSLQNTATGETDRGYLAPFAYYRLVLFDIARGAVVADARVTASTMYPVAGSGQGNPWDVVSAERKVDDLEKLLNKHTGDALRRLMAARAKG